MARYDFIFDGLGLREWCDTDKTDGPMSMAQLLAAAQGKEGSPVSARDATAGVVEDGTN